MNREQALAILHELTKGESLLRHARAVEVAMRALAANHGEDPEEWGIAGLLHDADYEVHPDRHPQVIVARLEALGEAKIAHAIRAHYTRWGVPYDTLLSRALVATDELTGFVTACCKVRLDGVQGLTAESVLKRFKDRAFAAKVEREEVLRACEIYGVGLKDHAAFLIEALKPFAEELQIAGRGT